MEKMYNSQGGLLPSYVDKITRKGESDHDIEDHKYALERVNEEFEEESDEDYYDRMEAEAQAQEVGRLEGQMEFYMRYKEDQDDDPEGFRIAKLLLGIEE